MRFCRGEVRSLHTGARPCNDLQVGGESGCDSEFAVLLCCFASRCRKMCYALIANSEILDILLRIADRCHQVAQKLRRPCPGDYAMIAG